MQNYQEQWYSIHESRCLACLDGDNDGFGEDREFSDEDGVLVGVRFIEAACSGTLNAA